MVRRCLCGGFTAAVLAALPLLAASPASAAGKVIRLDNDSNSRLEIKDTVVRGGETTILFWTWPDRGDPNFRNDCGKNYYTVTVRPGLPAAEPALLAGGACAGTGFLHGALLPDGSGKFIVHDRLEHWRNGKRQSSQALDSLETVGGLRLRSSELGDRLVDFSPAGDIAMAVGVSGHATSEWSGVTYALVGLKPDNTPRWLIRIPESETMLLPEALWAGTDGSALLHYATVDTTSIGADEAHKLMHIGADGARSDIPLVRVAEPFDFTSMKPGSEEDLQKAFAHMDENRSEGIAALAARPREAGGFDVLLRRRSEAPDRNGHFLLRLSPRGQVVSEVSLGSVIEDNGLDRWFDFYLEGERLVLLSSVQATQSGVNSRRRTWAQTVVSWIDPASGEVRSRLIPLDRRYLEAAMNAGDAGQQYLEGQPGGTPVMLATLGGVPLALERGWERKRGTLRIFEATDDLAAFTEYRDKQLASQAKAAEREQRRAARKAGQEQMQNEMAAAAGMSPEAFAALPEEEQVMRMMQGGGMEAVVAAAMRQAEAAQAGMTPEQAAQMQAQMAQVQQMMQGGAAVTANPAGRSPAAQQPERPTASFSVDSLNRGRVRFSRDGGGPVSLHIVDRESGEVLLEKTYPDGEIDDYVSLDRLGLPPDRLGALVIGADGSLLADLSPGSR